jgi:predicted homoserine dehydrogenase-like protein
MLQRLSRLERHIKIVVVGIGSLGRGIVYQAHITPYFECIGIANRTIEKAISCAEWLGRPYQIVQTKRQLYAAVEAGKLAITDDGNLLAHCELADVLIESSNATFEGAQHAITALKHGLHTIMVNAEADLTYGPLLLSIAESEGLVYSSCDGDQPAAIKRLVDQILFWGFDLVMAGNIKGYLDRYVNPTTIAPEADRRGLGYRICTSFTDGTKLCVEMSIVANALGLRTAVPGMIGPRAAHLAGVIDLFDFDALWGAERQPLVDYILGAQPQGGVFVIAHTDREYQQSTLAWLPSATGPGPYYLFYRNYHLRHFEALRTALDAVADTQALLKPDYGFRTNVIAYARQDLKQGDRLDGIGGYACYGLIENFDVGNNSCPGLPICLADGVILRHDTKKDERISFQDVIYDPDAPQFSLYAEALTIGSKSAI